MIQVFKNPKNSSKFSHICETRSLNENAYGIPKVSSIKITNKSDMYDNTLKISLPHVKQEVPLFVLFRAIGCGSDKDIIYHIIDNDNSSIDHTLLKLLGSTINEGSIVKTEEEAIIYLSKYINNTYNYVQSEEKKVNYVKDVILKEYLNHLGNDKQKKIFFTGYMVNKLLKGYLGVIPLDDRDSHLNKRFETTGYLLGNLTFQCFHKITKDIKNYVTKEVNSGLWNLNKNYNDIINEINIHKIIKSSYLENILKGAMATGNWGMKMNASKQGVSQVLNRLTYPSMVSHLRRIQTPSDNTGKLIPPRKLHSTSWGYICPSETPEGQAVGIVKNLSMNCEVTISRTSETVYHYICEMIEPFSNINIYQFNKIKQCKVFINGDWIGFTKEPKELVDLVKKYRRDGFIHIHTSIYWNIMNYYIQIYTDCGRPIRPLLLIQDKKVLYNETMMNYIIKNKCKWEEFTSTIYSPQTFCIEYIDPHESNNSIISIGMDTIDKNNYTHCEIHPSLILGALASCIPFPTIIKHHGILINLQWGNKL